MMKKTIFAVLTIVFIIIVSLYPNNILAIPEKKFKILVIYNSSKRESIISLKVIKWIYSTMWKIHLEILDISDQKNLPYLIDKFKEDSHNIVFFLNLIDGKNDMSKELWNTIYQADKEKVYISIGLAINIPEASKLFGCSTAQIKYVRNAFFVNSYLTENIPREVYLNRKEIVAKVIDGNTILYTGNKNNGLIVNKNNNLWIGLTELSTGLFHQYPYLLPLTENILKLSNLGYVKIEIPHRFVAIRIDDIPYSTESWFWRWQYFKPSEWRRFFDMLKKHGAHVNFMIIPYNVSKKDGKWVPYNIIFPQVIKEIKYGIDLGVVEVGDHGSTHVTPYQEYYINEKNLDPMKLTSTIRYEFGYDPHTKTHIPYNLQRYHIENGTKTIEKWFNINIKLFTPPWHVWDNVTEKALKDLGFKYISADFRFTKGWLDQPPSIMGEYTEYGLMNIPMTHSWDLAKKGDDKTIRYYIDTFLNYGIPVVFLSHGRNWTFGHYTEKFTIRNFENTLNKLEKIVKPEYSSLTRIGNYLMEWHKINTSYTIYDDKIVIRIVTDNETEIRVKTYKKDMKPILVIFNGKKYEWSQNITFKLEKGDNHITIMFKTIEHKNQYSKNSNVNTIIYALTFIVIFLISLFLLKITRNRKIFKNK